MQDIVLLLSAAAIFAFGWFLMGKLDGVLKQGHPFQEPAESSGEKRLRLGFFDPLAADSLSPALEGFEKKYPNVAVCLSCGAAGELLDGIVSGKLDAVFLPKDIVFPEKNPVSYEDSYGRLYICDDALRRGSNCPHHAGAHAANDGMAQRKIGFPGERLCCLPDKQT